MFNVDSIYYSIGVFFDGEISNGCGYLRIDWLSLSGLRAGRYILNCYFLVISFIHSMFYDDCFKKLCFYNSLLWPNLSAKGFNFIRLLIVLSFFSKEGNFSPSLSVDFLTPIFIFSSKDGSPLSKAYSYICWNSLAF